MDGLLYQNLNGIEARMSVTTGFDELQAAANASLESVNEARRRRDVFRDALLSADDVVEVIPTGSVARGTHNDPIHDVDVIAVFDLKMHPDWGSDGISGHNALEQTRELVHDLLGSIGTHSEEVRQTALNHHSVKCFLDDPSDTESFTVDVAPALRRAEGGLWIPETNNKTWIATDPERLNESVARRHSEWNEFAKLVRVLKRWNADHGKVMKSLVVEVLALNCLPVADKPKAISEFFAAAQEAVWSPVLDPVGLCGDIQPDLNRNEVHKLLAEAADLSWRAIDAEGRGETATAMCLWNQIFGSIYPEPDGGCAGSGASVVGLVVGSTAAVATTTRPRRPIRDAPQG